MKAERSGNTAIFRLSAFFTVTLISAPMPTTASVTSADVATSTSSAARSPITLEEAYKAALEKNETVTIANSRLNQAEARVAQARGLLRPKLSANANYLRQEDIGARTTTRDTNRPDQSSGRITLTQPLYSGGLLMSNLSAARAEREASLQDTVTARVNLFTNVARVFYEVRASEVEARNLEISIQLTEERISELQRRTRIGRSRSGEVLMAQSQLAVLQSQLEAIRSEAEIARDRFAFVTGLGRSAALSGLSDSTTKPGPLETYLELVGKRPDIAALTARLESSRADVRSARAGHLPSISLTGNSYLFRTGGGQSIDWDIGVALTIPIYEGGVVQGRVREAKEVETETTFVLRQLKREAESQVRAAYHALTGAIDQSESLQKALRTAERNYHEQTRDYRFGLVTNLDVLQALNTFQDTKRAHDRTRTQVELRRAELNAAISRLP